MEKSIRVYQTHIEVYPYSNGDSERLEKSLSKFDKVKHKWIPVAYTVSDNTLYLPKGISLSLLQREFNSLPISIPKPDEYEPIEKGEILVKPKSVMQSDAIDFLTSEGQFESYRGKSQFMLNLDTGDGKTVAAITAILKLRCRAMIIVERNKIKEQWLETLSKKTTVSKRQVLDIRGREMIDDILSGKERPRDFYIVNHQTLSSYARLNGWESVRDIFKYLKIGVKVIDEAHLFFNSTVKIDFFSNTLFTFYLTATFGRSDINEVKIYNKVFYSAARFGEETFGYSEKRKHIHLILAYFRSCPKAITPILRTKMGFSAYKYIDYELEDEYHSLESSLVKIIKETSHIEGKTLIISPKIESAEYFAKLIRKQTGEDVGTVHSHNTHTENAINIEKRYISSTPKSLGTGADITGLRILINLEPMSSISMDQLRGRLREYSKDKDTYLIYPVDTSIPEAMNLVRRTMPMFRRKCKKITAITI